jgi:hypothetical protein
MTTDDFAKPKAYKPLGTGEPIRERGAPGSGL